MASVNKVILVGNLGRDPEVRYMASGEAVCNFSIATTDTWKDINGQKATYSHRHNGYSNVNVYPEGAKVGSFYGVSETTPQRHILKVIA